MYLEHWGFNKRQDHAQVTFVEYTYGVYICRLDGVEPAHGGRPLTALFCLADLLYLVIWMLTLWCYCVAKAY